jgi:uncharacterized protein
MSLVQETKIGWPMADEKGSAGEEARFVAAAFAPRSFAAPWWLRGAHAQTIGGRLLRRPVPPTFRRERWDTPDGDFIDLDFAPPPSGTDPERTPIVLLLHGLEGSARRGYAIHTYDQLGRRGVRAVGLNFRSCSGEPNRTARFYHSGETEDIRYVIGRLRERFPAAPLGTVGFSLGGNAMLKYLGEEGTAGREGVDAAAAISVPYDLDAGARHLDASPIGRFYARLFVKSLTAKADAKAALLDGHIDLERVRAARTFRDFDGAATAPLHGFACAEDYYARCSSSGFIADIRVPTLLLHAIDDPFIPRSAVPHGAIASNPFVTAVITSTGGHVGFIHGSPWRPLYWAEEEAARFLAAALGPGAPRARLDTRRAAD